MIPPWAYLDDHDRGLLQAVVAFLTPRLAEQSTVDWAIGLEPNQRIERLAIEHVLNSPRLPVLDEPWGHAWRLIEESSSVRGLNTDDRFAIFGIKKRLGEGDRSGALISSIVRLVEPRLKLESIRPWRWKFVKKPKRPKKIDDVFSARLDSGELVKLDDLDVSKLTAVFFLSALGNSLEAAVNHGLDIARRFGWNERGSFAQLGGLSRVYYVQRNDVPHGDGDPDAYHGGIAPSVKLLHAVVSRISELDATSALPYILRWRIASSPVHLRLWAAMARSAQLVPAEEVGPFLNTRNDLQFWNLDLFPEIAELRAVRFGEIGSEDRETILGRILKMPPRTFWPSSMEVKRAKDARLYWAVRELKRIEAAGNELPQRTKFWLGAHGRSFHDLQGMTLKSGFPGGSTVEDFSPNPDQLYDSLEGHARLKALESGLASDQSGLDAQADSANAWLRQAGRAALILHDLEAVHGGGEDFPRVWDRFGWIYSPPPDRGSIAPAELEIEASRVLPLLEKLPDKTLSAAIEGISYWFDSWAKFIVPSTAGLRVWLRLWPIAVRATNSHRSAGDTENGGASARVSADGEERTDVDTLNTPAGRLIGVFLAACPSLQTQSAPFPVGSTARQMRDAIVDATGRSGLIARYRLIEHLPYFFRADREWAQTYLINPLLHDDDQSLSLWSSITRRTLGPNVLEIIGGPMAERALDRRLPRRTRQRLVFNLVVDSLYAFRDNRAPAVSNVRIQQMLRQLDDEVRSSAANTIQQFIQDLSVEEGNKDAQIAGSLFRSAAKPFFQHVWPQERSLATAGVSSALADLPATSGDAFTEAVDVIERFLVPFECWSMVNYGLYGEADGTRKLEIVNDKLKASAFLRLLDLTVGSAEGAIVPLDLTNALDQIRLVDPALASTPAYRRLSTAARR
jgi:hypothetical protein